MKTVAHTTIFRGETMNGVYCRAKTEQDATIMEALRIHFTTITGPDGGVFVKYKTIEQVREFVATMEAQINRPVYDMKDVAVVHEKAALLVDGTIVAGAIFDGNLFQKGMFFGGKWKADALNPSLDRRPLTVDVAGLDGEMVGEDRHARYTIVMTTADFQQRQK